MSKLRTCVRVKEVLFLYYNQYCMTLLLLLRGSSKFQLLTRYNVADEKQRPSEFWLKAGVSGNRFL